MPNETRYVAAIGALYNVPLVVVGVAFTAVAWFNGAELLLTIFTTFKKRSTYFYALIVASFGVLCFQSSVFCMIFAPWANGYGIIAGVDVGWTCMVTGQSLVLWSRLHLVCRSRWKLRTILVMIVTNAILCHGTQTVCSFLAIENNHINPDYLPFVYTEKVSLCLFFTQEVIISGVYIWETLGVFRLTQAVRKGGNYRRMRNLFLANVAILVLDVTLISMEFAALWGVWCTFKGFAYSIKLKIEFAILNQLRDTVINPNGSGVTEYSSKRDHSLARGGSVHADVQLAALSRQSQGFRSAAYRGGSATRSGDHDQIMKTTEYDVSHIDEHQNIPDVKRAPRTGSVSPSSSVVDFASKGA